MLFARTSLRICSRNAFAFTDPLPRKKMARSMMMAKVMMDTTKLTYIRVPPCSRNWASPCISCLLARGLRPLSAGRLGRGSEGFRKQGDGLYVVLGSSQLLECGRYLIGMAGGVKPSATRTRARSSLFQSRSGLRFWFDVDDYVGNLRELDLEFGGDP